MLLYILYVYLYCSFDVLIHKMYYFYYIFPEMNTNNTDIIFYNPYTYNIAIFSLYIYITYIGFLLTQIKQKNNNNHSLLLSLIYSKYLFNFISNRNLTIYEHEISRNNMWLFTTPIMIKMYADKNNMSIYETNIHYHLIPAISNILIYPYKKTTLYYGFTLVACISLFLFMKTFYKNIQKKFTSIYMLIWFLFISIHFIELTGLVNVHTINLCYFVADVIGKLTTNILITSYKYKEFDEFYDIDLQCLEFKKYMIKHILNYKNENAHITDKCNNLINSVNSMLITRLSDDNIIKNELLEKILPFNLEKNYIESLISNNNNNNNNIKHLKNICVLFTDIVNYTDLSSKFSDEIIFNLLNNIYNTFDHSIKKYSTLQKIETIGDAYMVVGDIFNNSDSKYVIKDIIEFSLEIMKSIKYIDTPNNRPLDLRVGINIGDVSIGILGNEIPRMCVVGHTVNMAARLQSTADVNSIQLSDELYHLMTSNDFCQHNIAITKNEKVFLKNIGDVNTYSIKIVS